MYIGFQSVAVDGTVKELQHLTVPPKATGVMLQAVTQNVAYTMDNATDPTTTAAMQLLTTRPPEYFLIEDLKRIRFTQGAGGAGVLNLHYVAGRDI